MYLLVDTHGFCKVKKKKTGNGMDEVKEIPRYECSVGYNSIMTGTAGTVVLCYTV